MSETQEYPTYEQSLKNYNDHREDLEYKHSILLEDKCGRNDFKGLVQISVIDEMLDRHLINVNFYSEQEKCIPLTYFDDNDDSQCDITCLFLEILTCYILMCFMVHFSKETEILGESL